MAETMQFDLVSPERRLVSREVTAVRIPGAEGDMTAMPHHAPVITSLRPGILTVESDKDEEDYVVTGGFAEIGESVSVLAEQAVPRSDMTQEEYDRMVDEAQAAYERTKEAFENEPGPVDDAAKLLADMVAMGTHMGMSTREPSL